MVTNRKFTVATGTLTLPTDVTTAVDTDIQDNSEDDSSNLRQKINRFLNLLNVQAVIVTIVVLDTMLVIFLLLMELNIIQDVQFHNYQPVDAVLVDLIQLAMEYMHVFLNRYLKEPSNDESKNFMKRSVLNSSQNKSTSDKVQQAEHVMHIIELIILTVFLMEILLRVFARGVDLVYDKWQVFDSLVVIVTFALYVSLTAAVTSRRVTYSVGFLILLRLWRIGRIHYDLTQPVIQKATSLIMAHRRAWRDTEEQLKQSYQQIERQQEKIESLKCKLRALHSVIGLKQSDSSLSTDTGLSDGEGCLNNQNITDSILAAIHIKPELSTTNIRSCSLPSALASGCFDANSSMSLPSSPKNLSCYHSKEKSVMSHGSSGKIPDLVEHTQGADIYRDPSFKEAITLQALALDRGWAYFSRSNDESKKEARRSMDNFTGESNCCSVDDVSHHGNWMAGEQNLGYTAQGVSALKSNITCSGIKMDSPKYIKNPDRCACDRVLTQHHREKSASTGALVRSGLSHIVDDDQTSQRNIHKGEPQCTTLPRRHKNNHASHDGKHYPQVNTDKIQLITEVNTGQGHIDYAFSNPSFALCLSPEELERIEREEIQRVSQIPFDQYGSISHLLREGIPISEL